MDIQFYIGILAGLCSLAGYFSYARSIVRGENKPERASWLIWTLSSALITLSYYVLGARNTIWVPLAYVLGSAGITILSFKYGREGWGLLERVTLVVASVSAVRWVFFENIQFTLFINLFVSFLSYVNRIRDFAAGQGLDEQDIKDWTLYFTGSILCLFAIEEWNAQIATLPIMYFLMNGIIFALVIRNRFRLKGKPAA